MGNVMGIDFGTTNSAGAFRDPNSGLTECIPNKEGTTLTASVVGFQNREEVLVGNIARDCMIVYPDTSVEHVKRLTGVEKIAITVDGTDYSPQQIAALIIKSLKEDAENELEQKIDQAVITVPAYFDSNRRQAIREAAMEAGFEVLDLLDEPLAAIYNADEIKNYDGEVIVVVDLGGGTLDIICARITATTIDELVISGDNYCGGSDWDKALVEYVKATSLKDAVLNAEARQELVSKAELAKKELSKKTETSFSVMTETGRKEVKITRKEFEDCTAELLNRAMNVLKEAKETMKSKGVERPDRIILCGGATRMPQIERGIAEIFPGVEMFGKDRDQAVAKGAAIYAEALMKEKQPEVKRCFDASPVKKLNRVSGRSYGIAAITNEGRKVCNMIRQNIELPASQEDVFYTHYDNQKQAALEVFENIGNQCYEETDASTLLGKCYLNIEGDIPKHSPIIVNMSLEENGVLHISAREESGNTQVSADMKTNALLSEEAFAVEKKQVEDLYAKVV